MIRGRAMYENFGGGSTLDSIFLENNTMVLTSELLNISFLGEGGASEALIFDNESRKKAHAPNSTSLTIHLDPDGEVLDINTASAGGTVNPTINVYSEGRYVFIIRGAQSFNFPAVFNKADGTNLGIVSEGTYEFYYDGFTYTLLNNSFESYIFSTIQTSNFTVAIGEYNLVDPAGGPIIVEVPAGITVVGTTFAVTDVLGNADNTNTITTDFATNGYTVHGEPSTIINDGGGGYEYIYVGSNNFIKKDM